MRLDPIETPKNLMLKMGYRMMKHKFGKVLTPLKIIYARNPALMSVALRIDKTSNSKLSLDTEFRLLIQVFASMTNGCNFCHDYRQTLTINSNLGQEKLQALAQYKTSAIFSRRERIALTYVEEALKNKRIHDETFSALKDQFTETEIVDLTWLIAAENYYNTLMIPLGIESDNLRALAEARLKH